MTRPLHFPQRVKDSITERRLDNLEQRSLTRPQTDSSHNVLPTGLSRAATIVVAASDAYTRSQEGADFVCTGINDDAIINEALDVGAGYPGGKILLTEGEFRIYEPLEAWYGQTLEGYGRDNTVLSWYGGASLPMIRSSNGGGDSPFNIAIRHLMLIGDAGANTAQDGIRLKQGAWNRIEDVVILDVDRHGINFDVSSFDQIGLIVAHCQIDGCGGSGIYLRAANRCKLVHNEILNTTDAAIDLKFGGFLSLVQGNSILSPGTYGIRLDGSSGWTIDSNPMYGGGTAGIYLAGSSDTNDLQGNRIENFTTGIDVSASTCDDNFLTINRLASVTTAINDSGTGTVKINNMGDDI